MKNKIKILNLKTNFWNGFMIASVFMALAFSSCNDAKEDSKEIAEDKNEAKFDNSKEKDAQFLVNATEINMEEIQLGKLAQTNSTMPEVKALGKMMEDDHTKALSDLQALAANKQITIPVSLTENGQEGYKKLKDLKGNDFDKEYCNMMVKGHKDAIDKFEKASTDATDADIKAWAATMLPTLRMHLDHSTECEKKCEELGKKY